MNRTEIMEAKRFAEERLEMIAQTKKIIADADYKKLRDEINSRPMKQHRVFWGWVDNNFRLAFFLLIPTLLVAMSIVNAVYEAIVRVL